MSRKTHPFRPSARPSVSSRLHPSHKHLRPRTPLTVTIATLAPSTRMTALTMRHIITHMTRVVATMGKRAIPSLLTMGTYSSD